MLLTVFVSTTINSLGRGENKHNSGKENVFCFHNALPFTQPLHFIKTLTCFTEMEYIIEHSAEHNRTECWSEASVI